MRANTFLEDGDLVPLTCSLSSHPIEISLLWDSGVDSCFLITMLKYTISVTSEKQMSSFRTLSLQQSLIYTLLTGLFQNSPFFFLNFVSHYESNTGQIWFVKNLGVCKRQRTEWEKVSANDN